MDEVKVDKFRNWKSTGAFFTFVSAYIYTITNGSVTGIVEAAGYIALYSSLFMMLRGVSAAIVVSTTQS